MPRRGRAWIGTSGFHYKHWMGTFYPPGMRPPEFLRYYAERFRTVELNNPFYRMPTDEALEGWREGSPDGFLFAVKASRFITHMKKLADPEKSIRKFFDGMEILGDKLGPVLFQLPPRWTVNVERLYEFLEALPKGNRYAFEFREESWLRQDVYDLLERYNAAVCAYDFDYRQSPVVVTGDLMYVRLHGPGARYRGSYSDEALGVWAGRMREWLENGIDVYCYFDNDEAAYAVKDALRLRELVGAIADAQSLAS